MNNHINLSIPQLGGKRKFRIRGLAPNTSYTFTLQLQPEKLRPARSPQQPQDPQEPQDTRYSESPHVIITPPQDGQPSNTTEESLSYEQVNALQETQAKVLHDTGEKLDGIKDVNKTPVMVGEPLEVTFKTGKCGRHDTRLVSAIENHDIAEVKRICTANPEVMINERFVM